jgi:hypothetical protein
MAATDNGEVRIALTRALTGALGVASGYTAFFLWLEPADNPRKFLLALAVAAFLSYIFELSRDLIQHCGGARPELSPSPPPITGISVSFVMLALADLLLMAWHSAAEMKWDTLLVAARAVIGRAGPESSPPWWDLVVLTGQNSAHLMHYDAAQLTGS